MRKDEDSLLDDTSDEDNNMGAVVNNGYLDHQID